MSSPKQAVSSYQLFALMSRSVIAVGLLGVAREVTEIGKQDGWIATLLCGALISLLIGFLVILCHRFPQSSLVEMIEYTLGHRVSTILAFVYGAYYFGMTAIITRELIEIISTWFLDKTPFWVIMVAGIIPVIYIAIKGIHCVVRFVEVIFMLSIPFLILIFMGIPYFETINIMPIGGVGAKNIVLSMEKALFAFSGYEIFLFFNPYIGERKNIRKMVVGAGLFATGIYTIVVLVQILFFGHEELQFLLYTVMKYLRSFEIPIIGRLELLFIFFWSAALCSTLCINLFLSGMAFCKGLSLGKKQGKAAYLFLGMAAGVVSLVPENTKSVLNILRWFGYTNVVVGMIIPLLVLLLSYRKKAKGGELIDESV
jgi:spore germination protein